MTLTSSIPPVPPASNQDRTAGGPVTGLAATRSRPTIRLAPLVPAIGVLLALAFGGLVAEVTHEQHRVEKLARDSYDRVVPLILERQQAAVNLERFKRFGALVVAAGSRRQRREALISAQALAFHPSFDFDEELSRRVLAAQERLREINTLRNSPAGDPGAPAAAFDPAATADARDRQAEAMWAATLTDIDQLTYRLSVDVATLTAERFAIIRETATWVSSILVAGLLALVLILGLAVGLAHAHVVRPVLIATEALRLMRTGQRRVRLPAGSTVEIDTIFRAVEQLRESEERSRLLLDCAGEGICGVDPEGRITFVNDTACRLLGYAAGEMIGHRIHPMMHARPVEPADIPGAVATSTEEVLRRKDGTPVEVAYTVAPLRFDAGVVGAVVTFRDVTERNRAVAALARERALLESLINTIPEPVFYKDCDGRFVRCNEATLRMVGRPDRASLIGVTADQLFPPDLAGRIAAAERRILAQRRAERAEEILPLPDGTILDVETIKVPFIDPSGAVLGLIGIARDISARKRAEAEMARAKEIAEAATLAKSEFLATMSHEVRTPLNAVLGMTHLVLGSALTPMQRDQLNKIRAASETLRRIVNDVLDFSKIEAGKLDLESTAFPLAELLETLTAVVAHRAEEKGIAFTIETSAAIPSVLIGDSLRLGQVLINLAGNAVKFTEKGSVTLTVSVADRTERTIGLTFAVRDTGIGMTDAQVARLFQPFAQADGSTTRRFGGTGLGLSIANRLVALMGGTIAVVSRLDQGSTFAFTVRFDLADPAPPPAAGPAPSAAEAVPLAGLRVLLVDDDPSCRETAAGLLAEAGVTVTAVEDGAGALRCLQSGDPPTQFDLILMDLRMPDPDGYETTRRLRADPRTAHLPILAVTAQALAEDQALCRAAGFNDRITKPVDPAALLAAVKRWCNRPAPKAPDMPEAPEAAVRPAGPPAPPPVRPGVNAGPGVVNEGLARLALLLAESDGAAVDLLYELAPRIEGRVPDCLLSRLESRIKTYEFAAAATALTEVRTVLDQPPL